MTTTNQPRVPTPTPPEGPSADKALPRLVIRPVTTTPVAPRPADEGDDPPVPVDVQSLPPTLSVEQAAVILGCGRTLAYALVRRGEFPCKVLRLGNRYVIPTADLLRAIGIPVRAAA